MEATRPTRISKWAVACLEAIAREGLGTAISLGGALGLMHYLDYRETRDVDAWWSAGSSAAEKEKLLSVPRDPLCSSRPCGHHGWTFRSIPSRICWRARWWLWWKEVLQGTSGTSTWHARLGWPLRVTAGSSGDAARRRARATRIRIGPGWPSRLISSESPAIGCAFGLMELSTRIERFRRISSRWRTKSTTSPDSAQPGTSDACPMVARSRRSAGRPDRGGGDIAADLPLLPSPAIVACLVPGKVPGPGAGLHPRRSEHRARLIVYPIPPDDPRPSPPSRKRAA